MIYRAAAAYPYDDAEEATTALRGQLSVMTFAGGGIPDWSTLAVEGPTESTAPHGPPWYEWIATLSADGGRDLTREPLDDDLRAVPSSGPLDNSTMPQSPIT